MDISDWKQAESQRSRAQLEAELADTKLLQSISTELIREDNIEVLYKRLVEAAVAIMNSDFASMQMLYPERGKGGELRLLASHGFTQQTVQFWQWVSVDSGSTCGEALRCGRRVIVTDVEQCDFIAGTADLAEYLQAGIHAIQSTPLLSRDGKVVGMISTHWRKPHQPSEHNLRLLDILARQAADLIERRRVQDALRQQTETLKETDRKKDEFLATLAHELRNPLAPIRSALQIMKLAKDNTSVIEQSRAMMERQLEQLVRLVDDLLDVSRISRGTIELQKERIELATVIRTALESCEALIKQHGHELTVTMPDEVVYLDADKVRLAQVLCNLLNNAAKYSDKGGRIGLSAERRGNDMVLRVKDSGVGIRADMLAKVFDLFMQVDRSLEKSQSGLGIGLTIVKQLVEMHGGQIEAKSGGHGQGSEFIILLPIAPSPTVPRPAELDGVPAGPPTRRRILVVDDNVDVAQSLAMMLEMMGNEVHMAHDGQQGVEAAAALRPELILLDIGMPKLNGYEACRRIRQEPWGQGIVLAALTGWGQDEDKRRSQEAGFDVHLVKPVKPSMLEIVLAQVRPAPSI